MQSGKLTKYEVEINKLTMTIRLENGEEITVVVAGVEGDVYDHNRTAEMLADDIYSVSYDDHSNPPAEDILKVTRTIADDGTFRNGKGIIEHRGFDEEE